MGRVSQYYGEADGADYIAVVEKKPAANQERDPKFILWVFLLCCSMAGIQFIYSVQFAVGGPLLNKTFGLSKSLIAVVMTTSGAISGFLVQPIVGAYSDTCTSKYGRRRPFIFGGMALCVIGMIFVGNSVQIGELFGDKDGSHTFGLIIAIGFLWVINISVNAMQGPARALIADLVPSESQQFANAILTATTGLSNVIANVAGAQFFLASDPYRILFMIGSGFIAVCTIATLLAAKETVFTPKEKVSKSPIDAFKKIIKTSLSMPDAVRRIFAVYFFSWCAYSPFMIFLTLYYGGNLACQGIKKCPDDQFDHGVQLGMYGLAIFAGVSFVYSWLQTPLLKVIGVRATYCGTQVIATVCFGLMWFFAWKQQLTLALAFVLTALVATNFTAFLSIPFAILADSVPNDDVGLYMGVLNSAATVSQVLTNVLAGTAIVGQKDDDVSWGILFGAAISACTCALVWIIKVPAVKKYDTPSEESPLIQH